MLGVGHMSDGGPIMRRLISTVLCVGLAARGMALAAEEEIVQQLTANGSRTTRPFTVKDGWEVRVWSSASDGTYMDLAAKIDAFDVYLQKKKERNKPRSYPIVLRQGTFDTDG